MTLWCARGRRDEYHWDHIYLIAAGVRRSAASLCVITVAGVMILLSIGVAILRYLLFDIDVLLK